MPDQTVIMRLAFIVELFDLRPMKPYRRVCVHLSFLCCEEAVIQLHLLIDSVSSTSPSRSCGLQILDLAIERVELLLCA